MTVFPSEILGVVFEDDELQPLKSAQYDRCCVVPMFWKEREINYMHGMRIKKYTLDDDACLMWVFRQNGYCFASFEGNPSGWVVSCLEHALSLLLETILKTFDCSDEELNLIILDVRTGGVRIVVETLDSSDSDLSYQIAAFFGGELRVECYVGQNSANRTRFLLGRSHPDPKGGRFLVIRDLLAIKCIIVKHCDTFSNEWKHTLEKLDYVLDETFIGKVCHDSRPGRELGSFYGRSSEHFHSQSRNLHVAVCCRGCLSVLAS